MTKRNSKTLSFFCSPEELDAVLKPTLAQFGLTVCVAEKKRNRWFLYEIEAPARNRKLQRQVYLFDPAEVENGINSLANIVQVWFPAYAGDALCMGEIGMLVAESDIGEKMAKLQLKAYQGLQINLIGRFLAGVWGRNSKTGGEHFYKNILISKEVDRSARGGLVLRTLLGDGYVTFSPTPNS